MQNIEYFDKAYAALKEEIKKAQTATTPDQIASVERITNRIVREIMGIAPRLSNDVVAICRKRRKELAEGK